MAVSTAHRPGMNERGGATMRWILALIWLAFIAYALDLGTWAASWE
ncbi:hypothetical protein [Paenibacillus sp. ALJ109b]|nr:hypothetical protein [Paenibacillus sp. ALJ109b]NEU64056.1 hypothetical protein [Paenibacillus sp. ALJ109b]